MGDLEETLNKALTPVSSMLPEVTCGDVKLSLTVVE
jgi:hypothetical protein